MTKLSKLEKVPLREVWVHEAYDFTQWLAKSENLELLSDAIGIEITSIETEASVGKFNVDILAEEENTGRKIVIENQLELTDHDHLGKIITYASGVNAEIIIWIVKNLRDEHKQAVDWLNEHTDSDINFFVVEMEVWRIDDSPYAPRFYVIAKPNDWTKEIKKATSQSQFSSLKLSQLEYWTKLKEYIEFQGSNIKPRKPYAQHWYDFKLGTTEAHLTLTINSQSNQKSCELYIRDNKTLFDLLHQQKDDIEYELSEQLNWERLPQKKASRIKLISSSQFSNPNYWEDDHHWMLEKLTKFDQVFGKYIKQLQRS